MKILLRNICALMLLGLFALQSFIAMATPNIKDGDVIKGDQSPKVYMIHGGEKHYISDVPAFQKCGLIWTWIEYYPQKIVDGFPGVNTEYNLADCVNSLPKDKSVLKQGYFYKGQEIDMYVYDNNKLRNISTPQFLGRCIDMKRIVVVQQKLINEVLKDNKGKPANFCSDIDAVEAPVTDQVIAWQRESLAKNTEGKGFGPQSPRDINSLKGNNRITFKVAPAYTKMNLCNIHFHKNAEHKGKHFNKYAGNGDGFGYHSGYEFSGNLSEAELTPLNKKIGVSKHGSLSSGDTIEVHYVYSTDQVKPGPELSSCLSGPVEDPQLRVEAQVYVLINSDKGRNFVDLTKVGVKNGKYQAVNIPNDIGTPIQYAGSTTGPGFNQTGSPLQVTWSVRPEVAKVNILTVGEWLKGNVFDEDHAHGVRNLIMNPDFLSKIK